MRPVLQSISRVFSLTAIAVLAVSLASCVVGDGEGEDGVDEEGESVSEAISPYRLYANETLYWNQSIRSPNGKYKLVFQSDQNLVLYNVSTGRALWARGWNTGAVRTVMQGDGNLVMYRSDGRAVWASNTWGNPGAYAVLQDDGNFVVYSSSGRALWATNTVERTGYVCVPAAGICTSFGNPCCDGRRCWIDLNKGWGQCF